MSEKDDTKKKDPDAPRNLIIPLALSKIILSEPFKADLNILDVPNQVKTIIFSIKNKIKDLWKSSAWRFKCYF